MDKHSAIKEAGQSIDQALLDIMQLPGGSDVTAVARHLMNS
jgi:hypothetical protein